MKWYVYRDGRYAGIVETNKEFAGAFYAERARVTGAKYTLSQRPPDPMTGRMLPLATSDFNKVSS